MAVTTRTVDARDLWTRYKRQGDENARLELIERYAYLARAGAERLRLPPHAAFSQDDLYGYAVLGLIDAIEKFDPDKGKPFEAYAPVRIRGAISDALRGLDWLPRSVRQNETRLREAMARIEMREGRSATDAELCAELGMSEDELGDLLQAANASAQQSLEEIISELGDLNFAGVGADNSGTDPERAAENSQVRRLLVEAIEELPENEKTVISLYYFEDLTLKEIGRVLGVTESRACQLHTRAVLKLQTRLACWLDVMFMAA
ncbi:MAG: RNA polymerase sigma factor WhiG [Armatimonadota bacterium]|nr:MAG: RNA polymerase sigma factor WhiG [Armatimonadota bacterium]GIV82638.1 MAG: RNA polymerase sigma factor WhiG [Anaerolineae bacterium]